LLVKHCFVSPNAAATRDHGYEKQRANPAITLSEAQRLALDFFGAITAAAQHLAARRMFAGPSAMPTRAAAYK